MGYNAPLQTDVEGMLILILTDACAGLTVGTFVIGVQAGGVAGAGIAQPFLNVPVQVLLPESGAVKTHVVRRALFGVVHVVRRPGVMHPAIERNGDAQRKLVVV